MSEDEKILWMFNKVHGEITGACYLEVEYDDEELNPIGVHLMKHGNICWTASKLDLVFDFLLLGQK